MLIIVAAHHSVDLDEASDQSLIKFSHMISVSIDLRLIKQLSEKLSEHFHQQMTSVVDEEGRDSGDIMPEIVVDHLSQVQSFLSVILFSIDVDL